MARKKSIGTKMNDLDLCLEVVSGHVIGVRKRQACCHGYY